MVLVVGVGSPSLSPLLSPGMLGMQFISGPERHLTACPRCAFFTLRFLLGPSIFKGRLGVRSGPASSDGGRLGLWAIANSSPRSSPCYPHRGEQSRIEAVGRDVKSSHHGEGIGGEDDHTQPEARLRPHGLPPSRGTNSMVRPRAKRCGPPLSTCARTNRDPPSPATG